MPKTISGPSAGVIADLRAELAGVVELVTSVTNKARAEGRELTALESAQMMDLNLQFNQLEASITAEQMLAKANPRRSMPEDAARPARSITGGDRAGTAPGMWGFQSVGDWAATAYAMKHGQRDERIMNAPTTFGSEGINQDGGFLVPPDFRQAIKVLIENEENLAARCDQQTSQSNSITYPVDAVSPWDTANGVQVNWTGEGKPITQTKPNVAMAECKAHKVSALVPLSEEIVGDVPLLTNWLNTKVPQKFNSELNNVIVGGNGIAKPLGLLNSACKVTQTAEAGQATATIVYNNITKMFARMYAPLRYDAIWIANQDVDPQLQSMVIQGTNSGVFPAWLPPGGLSGSKFATLLGRPLIYVEECSALGTEGDLILTNLSQYLLLMKGGGIRSDVSIHLYFDTGHIAFRFEMRVGGQSYWPSTVARKNSALPLSPIITLATRP